MKRYNKCSQCNEMEEEPDGEWVKHSDAMEVVEVLDKTVDERNEYFDLNKEMLEVLIECKDLFDTVLAGQDPQCKLRPKLERLIQKVEGE